MPRSITAVRIDSTRTPIAAVVAKIVAHEVHHLPVPRNGNPAGVVTTLDLMGASADLAEPD